MTGRARESRGSLVCAHPPPSLSNANAPKQNHSTIYNMCTQKPPYDFSEQLYARYREAFKTYIASTVRQLCRCAPRCPRRRRPIDGRSTPLPKTQPPKKQVLPALREHRDEVLLKELYHRWCNHKLMVRWLSRFFNYLDR